MSVHDSYEKVAVVTGGSSGIGLAVAEQLRSQGFRLGVQPAERGSK